MKPRTIIITATDRDRLRRCINDLLSRGEVKETRHIDELEDELGRATIVADSKEVPPDVITMRSKVRLRDLDSGEEVVYTLVYPAESNAEKNLISVLAPIGVAMLGYRVGDAIEWAVPRGKRRLRVEEILYQPEAAKDFHL
ncbi:MAG TPA: nucleoside diphosphate kinase regulator [Candidatus Hydrogenedentes bacterium]|nr:nucleoside diphosphate kinase regulator [Candidatus Hydrogenedentota bacterium]HNT87819.1 nucleoside diphosphate kinase regulator [Candidatus Hydrogenedentota bacterium]